MPLRLAGSSDQSGWRRGAVTRSATTTAAPMTGKLSSATGYQTFATTFAEMAVTRMKATMRTRAQSTRMPSVTSARSARSACCWRAAMMPKTNSATTAAT